MIEDWYKFSSVYLFFRQMWLFFNFMGWEWNYTFNISQAGRYSPFVISLTMRALICFVTQWQRKQISQRFYRAVIDKVRKKDTGTFSPLPGTHRVWRIALMAWTSRQEFLSFPLLPVEKKKKRLKKDCVTIREYKKRNW